MGALLVVIALISYQQLAPQKATRTTESQQAGVAAARSASLSPAGAISIAVLPFANMSGDATQEFFSDGMSEEITSALAKIPDLRVVARESAFQFKGEKKDLRAIGQSLSATHLIEGSVRKVGDRVRITAQLVQADNGLNVWTDSYDRDMTDVFAIQEDIARKIAASLRMPLGLKPDENLVSNRTIDPESYQLYLRAKALVRTRGLKALTDGAALLEQIVARDPDYAPAWALLALAYDVTLNQQPAYRSGSVPETRRIVDASLPKSEAAARRAIQLDPNHADGYVSLGFEQADSGKLLPAEDALKHALALDPNNPDALHRYSMLLAQAGRLKEALSIRQQLQTLEPFDLGYDVNLARIQWLNGQDDAAIAIFRVLPPGSVDLARIYAAAGRYAEVVDVVSKVPSSAYLPGIVESALRILRTAPAAAASPQTLPPLGNLGFVYLSVRAPGRVLDFYEAAIDDGFLAAGDSIVLWHPSYTAVRKTERFKAFARKFGLVEYWRAKGWPDLCRSAGADDFICD